MLVFLCIKLLKTKISKTRNHIALPKTGKMGGKNGLKCAAWPWSPCTIVTVKQDQQTRILSLLMNISVGKHSIPSSQMHLQMDRLVQESTTEIRKDSQVPVFHSTADCTQTTPKRCLSSAFSKLSLGKYWHQLFQHQKTCNSDCRLSCWL